jgi:hypothetical protein
MYTAALFPPRQTTRFAAVSQVIVYVNPVAGLNASTVLEPVLKNPSLTLTANGQEVTELTYRPDSHSLASLGSDGAAGSEAGVVVGVVDGVMVVVGVAVVSRVVLAVSDVAAVTRSTASPLTLLVGPEGYSGLTARHGGQGSVPLSLRMAWGVLSPTVFGCG